MDSYQLSDDTMSEEYLDGYESYWYGHSLEPLASTDFADGWWDARAEIGDYNG